MYLFAGGARLRSAVRIDKLPQEHLQQLPSSLRPLFQSLVYEPDELSVPKFGASANIVILEAAYLWTSEMCDSIVGLVA